MPINSLADQELSIPFRNCLARILERAGRFTVNNERHAGERTMECRWETLTRVFAELSVLGYKLPSPESLRETHVKALMAHWLEKGMKPATIQNKLTHLRQFSKWIGKPGMVRHTEYYVDESNKHLVRRSVVAKENLGWNAKGVDPLVVIEAMRNEDKWTALYLRLMYAFGLRLKEAVHLRPEIDVAISGLSLSVRDGTKGGRQRMIPIENDYQRATLALAQQMAIPQTKRIIPAKCTLGQAYNRARYRMQKIGLTRDSLGVTAHGLRHQYAQASYERIAGQPSPIAGGNPDGIDFQTHLRARYEVMERLGHSRVDISATYCGTYAHALRGKVNPAKRWEDLLLRETKHNFRPPLSAGPKVSYKFVLP